MIKLRKNILIAALISSSFTSFIAAAGCTENGCLSKVDTLYMSGNGNIFIGTTDDEKLLDCDAVSDVYITLKPTHKNFEPIYSALLATQLADKEIYLRILNGSDSCELSYASLKS